MLSDNILNPRNINEYDNLANAASAAEMENIALNGGGGGRGTFEVSLGTVEYDVVVATPMIASPRHYSRPITLLLTSPLPSTPALYVSTVLVVLVTITITITITHALRRTSTPSG